MTYDEFWNGPSEMARYFRKADKMRKSRQNLAAWMQGAYFADALGAALSGFGKGSARGYCSEPFPLPHEEEERREREKQRLIARLDALRIQHSKRKDGG